MQGTMDFDLIRYLQGIAKALCSAKLYSIHYHKKIIC